MRRYLLATAIVTALAGCDGRGVGSGSDHGVSGGPIIPAQVKPLAMGRADLVLLVTGGTHGMMEVCNCAGPMVGGLARRSGLVRSYRAACDNVFLLDVGDVFWVDPEDLRNGYVLKGYQEVGYDAVVLGDQEWAAKSLGALLSRGALSYLSTNVAAADASSRLPVRRAVTRRLGHVKLAVLSYVSPEAFRFTPEGTAARVRVSGLDELLLRAAALKESGHVVVLVAHVEPDQIDAVVRRGGVDLVIRGHTTRCGDELSRIDGTPVAKVGGYPYVGVLAMKLTKAGRIEEIEYRVETVTEHWPMDGRLIQTYQAYAHIAMRKALDADREAGLSYVPSAKCGKCHPKQYAAWSAGPHSRAYKTLRRAGRTGDPNCITCHTTGFGSEKGFYTFDKTPELAGVNCQDCHRFDITADHEDKSFVNVRPRVDRTVCESCHTPITDPKDDYAIALTGKPYKHR